MNVLERVAERRMEEKLPCLGPGHKYNFAQASHWMTTYFDEYFVLRIEFPHSLSWFLSQYSDVYVVHLLGNSRRLRQWNDHEICIKSGAKQIIDCVETFVERTGHGPVSCFVRDSFDLDDVSSIRLTQRQPKTSSACGKRGSRPANKLREKRRRKSEAK